MLSFHQCIVLKGPRDIEIVGAARACCLAYLQGAIAFAESVRETPRDRYFDDQYQSLPAELRSRHAPHFTLDDFLALDRPSLTAFAAALAGATPGAFLDACTSGWTALNAQDCGGEAVVVRDPDTGDKIVVLGLDAAPARPDAGPFAAVAAMAHAGLNHFLGIRVCPPAEARVRDRARPRCAMLSLI